MKRFFLPNFLVILKLRVNSTSLFSSHTHLICFLYTCFLDFSLLSLLLCFIITNFLLLFPFSLELKVLNLVFFPQQKNPPSTIILKMTIMMKREISNTTITTKQRIIIRLLIKVSIKIRT